MLSNFRVLDAIAYQERERERFWLGELRSGIFIEKGKGEKMREMAQENKWLAGERVCRNFMFFSFWILNYRNCPRSFWVCTSLSIWLGGFAEKPLYNRIILNVILILHVWGWNHCDAILCNTIHIFNKLFITLNFFIIV